MQGTQWIGHSPLQLRLGLHMTVKKWSLLIQLQSSTVQRKTPFNNLGTMHKSSGSKHTEWIILNVYVLGGSKNGKLRGFLDQLFHLCANLITLRGIELSLNLLCVGETITSGSVDWDPAEFTHILHNITDKSQHYHKTRKVERNDFTISLFAAVSKLSYCNMKGSRGSLKTCLQLVNKYRPWNRCIRLQGE